MIQGQGLYRRPAYDVCRLIPCEDLNSFSKAKTTGSPAWEPGSQENASYCAVRICFTISRISPGWRCFFLGSRAGSRMKGRFGCLKGFGHYQPVFLNRDYGTTGSLPWQVHQGAQEPWVSAQLLRSLKRSSMGIGP